MMISTIEFYATADAAIRECRTHGHDAIADKIEDAKSVGSSGLEIVGAIGGVFKDHSTELRRLMGSEPVEDVSRFVDRCYGRSW